MLWPPMIETMFKVTWPLSISASRRSMSSPPMTATTFTAPRSRKRPGAWRPPHDSAHPANGAPPAGGHAGRRREITRQRLQLAAGPRDERHTHAFLQLIEGQPTDGGMLAQELDGLVTFLI